MNLKFPEIFNVSVKAARGFAFNQAVYALRPEKFFMASFPDVDKGFIPLELGEETEILVRLPGNIPANANIKRIAGKFHARDMAGLEPQQTKVDVDGPEGKKAYNLGVETPSRPRNIELRLDKGDIFWTFTGILTKESYDLPNFAKQVNAYLDKVEPEGDQITLRFLVKSDTNGKAKITIEDEDIEYSQLQTQIWENPLDNTFRIDRNLQLEFSASKEVPLGPISDNAHKQISLRRIEIDVGGEFGRERLLGSVKSHEGKEFATIGSEYSLAQKFELDTPIQCVGVSGLFRVEEDTELYIEIQKEDNGFPAAGSPLTKANLSLTPDEKNIITQWAFSKFEVPVNLKTELLYWIVIKGIQGKVRLGLQDQKETYLKEVLVNRGGQLWKSVNHASNSTTAAFLRLAYLPEVDNQMAAVEIGIKGTSLIQSLDPGAEAQTISFKVDGIDIKEPAIIIKSHARGMLNIANVIQEY